ncbi:ankyrin [Trametes coccinea BRFM310]|uniref:Ankyrin n=1 Tax=Trametes coccinea (strain BRFM310) TaxID=1353009 RepID=A0A1Y2IZ02_TRAC3|nr:ankyrin [Trametes coccinea BRFM310]
MTSSSRAPLRAARAALDATLIDAAARADLDAVRTALANGADANAVDEATGYTAVTCAIAGDSWEDVDVSDASFMLQDRVEVLRTLIGSDTTSLYALNAPARGVTPLGLAAWLNIPDVIRVLLDEGRGLVAVDGTDAVGVTPLMYTARDGAVETASLLLVKGARPDLRDTHHRTAVQHALRHPQLLYMCESALRKQRAWDFLHGNRRRLSNVPQSYIAQVESWMTLPLQLKAWHPPSEATLSKATAALIRAACTGDVLSLYQHLYITQHRSSILVNRLDSQGWSPLHYCVCAANPSFEVLDALFLAGADTSLYTSTKHGTPLHCLARKAQDPVGEAQVAHLHAFVRHLVLDLRAPLSAKDENGETCIHVAAERGQSIEVLLALIACDTRGAVRKMTNSRGLTPLEVARPELRFAFGPDAEPRRSSSVASFRTVRPSTSSMSSTSSFASFTPANPHIRPQVSAIFRPNSPLPEVDASLLPHRILENLTQVGYDYETSDALELDGLSSILDETVHLGELWVRTTQARIREAAQDLRDARGRLGQVDTLLEDVTRDLEAVFGARFRDDVDQRNSLECARRRTTDSGDSDATAVSGRASSQLSRKWRSMSDLRSSSDASRHQSDVPDVPYLRTKTIEEEDEPPASPEKPSTFLDALLSPTASRKSSKSELSSGGPNRSPSPLPSTKKDSSASSTARLKAWFRKKLKIDYPDTIQEKRYGHNAEKHAMKLVDQELLSTSRCIIRTANRDMSSIEGCMDNADHYLSLASHMILQTERRLKMVILNRRANLETARLAQLRDHLDDPFMTEIASTVRSAAQAPVPFPCTRARSGSDSDYSFSSTSASSSVISLSSTLNESEDDDTRILRRFITRKVEARTEGALEEIDKVMTWLRIVQDTLRSLRRRTHASTNTHDSPM